MVLHVPPRIPKDASKHDAEELGSEVCLYTKPVERVSQEHTSAVRKVCVPDDRHDGSNPNEEVVTIPTLSSVVALLLNHLQKHSLHPKDASGQDRIADMVKSSGSTKRQGNR